MGMPVVEAQARISSAEFAEWVAYSELEPFGPPRDDARAGVVASVMANVNREARRPYEPADFFPNLGTLPAPEQTPDEQLAIMQLITDSMMSRGNP